VWVADAAGRLLWSSRGGCDGASLHEALHGPCGDPDCDLAGEWQRLVAATGTQQRASGVVHDALLQRTLTISAQLQPRSLDTGDGENDCFVVSVAETDAGVQSATAVEPPRETVESPHEGGRFSLQHLDIQESERSRIAAELHDGLGQTLCLVKQSIDELTRGAIAAAVAGKLQSGLQRASALVTSALADMHRMAMNLQPAMLNDLGLVPTLTWYMREMQSAYPDVTFVRRVELDEAVIPEALRLPVFRIVQEATCNALKHSRANRIKVVVAGAARTLKVTVEDNGCGFDPCAPAARRDATHGLGLQTMRQRAESSGGAYRFESTPGKGTRVAAMWRISQSARIECPDRAAAQAFAPSSPPLHEDCLGSAVPNPPRGAAGDSARPAQEH
jgi:signal transduction histidine kinase